MSLRTFELASELSSRERGRAHGEAFRGEIASLADLRVYLTREVGGFPDDATVYQAAREHLPVLLEFDRDLHDELAGIAEGANTSPERIVVLNHYTDLRDLPRSGWKAAGTGRDTDEGCSVLYAETPGGPLVGQTWDMHATAMPYVMMLRVGRHPDAWLLSLTGCLGMAGMNENGVCVAINNLHSNDAGVGVVWSALVRKALSQQTAAAARQVIVSSRVGSGHHYLVADDTDAYGIETSGTLRQEVFSGGSHFVHTNHCVDREVAEQSRVPPNSTTYDRLSWLAASVEGAAIAGPRDAWQRLGSHEGYPRSVCTNMATAENPHGAATCGAVVMDISRRLLFAAGGFIHNVPPLQFGFGGDDGG